MYAIFDVTTQQQLCAHPNLRSPQAAWNHFRDHYWKVARVRPDGAILDWDCREDRKKYFECRLIGERAPVLKLAGHRLEVQCRTSERPWSYEGTCGCGWRLSRSSKGELQQEYRAHLEMLVPGAAVIPRPAEHLPAAQRVEKSLEKLKSTGGERKTFRLQQSALKELDRMVSEEHFPNHTAALEARLVHPSRSESSGYALYPMHVEDDQVRAVVDEAVRLACRELDSLFPGVAPDGGKGISSNFQGLLVEHVNAMLTGQNQARRSHHTHLPTLLANDQAFGAQFRLPAVQGAGYVVLSPSTGRALSAYSGRFMPVFRGREASYNGGVRMLRMFGDGFEGELTRHSPLSAYAGSELHFQNDEPDILYCEHEGAVRAALAAQQNEDSSPADDPLKVVAAVYDGSKNCFVILAHEA